MIRRIPIIALALLLASCLPAETTTRPATQSATQPGKIPDIPHVRSIKDITRLKPIPLKGDWQVRLGWADGGTAAGPWKIIYCYTEYTGKDKTPKLLFNGRVRGGRVVLGPVFIDSTRVNVNVKRVRISDMMAMRASLPVPGKALYCCLVPFLRGGRYQIKAYSQNDKELARTIFKIDKPAPCYWQQFAVPKHSGKQDKLAEKGTSTHVVHPSPKAVMPTFEGLTPIWPPDGKNVKILRENRKNPSLPGQIPMGLPWVQYYLKPRSLKVGEVPRGLQLTLVKGDFVIRSEATMVARPDRRLLARWWVNGKAVLPPWPEKISAINIGGLVPIDREMKVAFGLPKTLGRLKVGDKVALQVMYSPGMVQVLTDKPLPFAWRLLKDDIKVPLLSNRLEFVVRESMLTGGKAPAVNPVVMAILERLEAAGDKYPNITAKIDYKVDMLQTGDTEARTGKVYYQGPGKKEPAKFRIHFDTLRQGAGPKIKDVVDYAFDGAWLTVRKQRIKQMTRYQVAPPGQKVNPLQLGKGPFPVPFGQKAKTVIKHFRPSTRPLKKADPKNTDYLKLTTRRRFRREFSVVWLEMWVDRKKGLPVKIVAEDRSENITTVLFRDIKTPKSFPKKTFTLPRPPGSWEYHVERYKGIAKP